LDRKNNLVRKNDLVRKNELFWKEMFNRESK
jgi:hypothetical protein